LFISPDSESKEFQLRIRAYNNILSLTSLRTTECPYTINNSGIYSFCIQGVLYYNYGTLL
ncbi:hypothetical protein L873DRAFT_1597362, partial [Choiromyces venosus 120613-1]